MLKNKKYIKEIKKLSSENLNLKVVNLKKQLLFLKIKMATKQQIRCNQIKQTKKQIAQLLTIETLSQKNK